MQLRLKFARAQVEMNPILAVLALGNLLKKNPGAPAIGRQQALMRPVATPSRTCPSASVQNSAERSSWEQPSTTTSSPPQVRVWLTAHDLILHRRGVHGVALSCHRPGASSCGDNIHLVMCASQPVID